VGEGEALAKLRALYIKAHKDYTALRSLARGVTTTTVSGVATENLTDNSDFYKCIASDISGTKLDNILTNIKLGTISSGVQAVGGGLQLAGGIIQHKDQKKIENQPYTKIKIVEGNTSPAPELEAVSEKDYEYAAKEYVKKQETIAKGLLSKVQTAFGVEGSTTLNYNFQENMPTDSGPAENRFSSAKVSAAFETEIRSGYSRRQVALAAEPPGQPEAVQDVLDKAVKAVKQAAENDTGIISLWPDAERSEFEYNGYKYTMRQDARKANALAIAGTVVGGVGGVGAAASGIVGASKAEQDGGVQKAAEAVSKCESGVSAVTGVYDTMAADLPNLEDYNWSSLSESDKVRYSRYQALYNAARSTAAIVRSKCEGISGKKFSDAFTAFIVQAVTGGVGGTTAILTGSFGAKNATANIVGGSVNFAAGAAGTIVGAMSWKGIDDQISKVKSCSGAASNLINRVSEAMKAACDDKETCDGDDCCILPANAGEYGDIKGLSVVDQQSVDSLRTQATQQFNAADTNYNRARSLAASIEELCSRHLTECGQSGALKTAVEAARNLLSGTVSNAYTNARNARENINKSTYACSADAAVDAVDEAKTAMATLQGLINTAKAAVDAAAALLAGDPGYDAAIADAKVKVAATVSPAAIAASKGVTAEQAAITVANSASASKQAAANAAKDAAWAAKEAINAVQTAISALVTAVDAAAVQSGAPAAAAAAATVATNATNAVQKISVAESNVAAINNTSQCNMTVEKARAYLRSISDSGTSLSNDVGKMGNYLTQAQNAASDTQNEGDIAKAAALSKFSSAQARYIEVVQKWTAADNAGNDKTSEYYKRAKQNKLNLDATWAAVSAAKQALDLATGENVAAKAAALVALIDNYPGTGCGPLGPGCSCNAVTPNAACYSGSFAFDVEALKLNVSELYTSLAEVKQAAETKYLTAKTKRDNANNRSQSCTWASGPGATIVARMHTEWTTATTAYQKVNNATTLASAIAAKVALDPLLNPCTAPPNCFDDDADIILTNCP
jgi:hypothetical protein